MNIEHAKNKIAYACIFCKSTRDAANNLRRLITNQECGYEEGADWWAAVFKQWLDDNYDVLQLNCFGASFTAEEWRLILTEVTQGLATRVS